MNSMTRRTLLMSTAAVGFGTVAACTRSQQSNSGEGTERSGRFGAGTYNTQEVADELRYIEENIRPRPRTDAKRVLITGSTGGIGQLAAAHLLARGHSVVAHARNEQRAADVRADLPAVDGVVIGDLLDLDQTRALATQINELPRFDVIIHNAGEYGIANSQILNANSLSPYLLTSLVNPPADALVYLTSDLHLGGDLEFDELRGDGTDITYDDSKLHVATLAMAVARRRPDIRVNAVAPGWVPTKMGFHNGPYAPDDLRAGYMTQVWLAEGTEAARQITGNFLFHQQPETQVHPAVHDPRAQDDLLAAYAQRTGTSLT